MKTTNPFDIGNKFYERRWTLLHFQRWSSKLAYSVGINTAYRDRTCLVREISKKFPKIDLDFGDQVGNIVHIIESLNVFSAILATISAYFRRIFNS